jgi:integrase
VNLNMRDDSPVKNDDVNRMRNHETKRRRYLRDGELGRLLVALSAHHTKDEADVIRLLLLTGSRRGEILAMRFSDIDMGKGVWNKRAADVKQDEDHSVPLSAPVRLLLSERAGTRKPLPTYVFAGAGSKAHIRAVERAWRQICRAAEIEGLRIHDLRHSFASQLVSSGHSLEMIGSLLGHASVATTKRYSHLFDSAQRQAVESVAAAIEAAAGNGNPASAEVVPLPRRGR